MKRLAVVALVVATSAQAGDYLQFKMIADQAQPFVTYVDSRSQSPGGVAYQSMQNAVERAWATWNAVQCASVKTRSLGPSVGTVPDPMSTVDAFSVTPVWVLTQDPDAAEIFGNAQFVAAISLPRAYAGVLQTCDTYFNAFSFQWSTDVTPPINSMDVETVMLHEAGHCLGLDHYTPYEAVMDSSVYAGQTKRVLTATDFQKFCARYPATGESGAPCLGDGGCLQSDLKCLTQPVTNNVSLKLCTRGCGLGTNANCDLPMSCQASSAFSGFNGACLLPGSIVTQVGKPCTMDSECGNSFGTCRRPEPASGNNNFFWVDGYCTQSCAQGEPVCPAGSTCVGLDVGPRCAQSCRVGLADCRPDYACAAIDAIGTSGVCIPRCYSDLDCADPLNTTCRTCDGVCVAKQNATARIGDGCAVDTDCGPGQSCRITGATSTVKQCTQQCSRGCALCPSGSSCTPGARGELFCLRDCTGPGTCPNGLRCGDTPVGKACLPLCDADSDCPVGQGCAFGECVTAVLDAGCGTLCNKPDAGRPVVVTPKDAGPGTGGTGGCGCSTVDPLAVLSALSLLGLSRRRSAWRAR